MKKQQITPPKRRHSAWHYIQEAAEQLEELRTIRSLKKTWDEIHSIHFKYEHAGRSHLAEPAKRALEAVEKHPDSVCIFNTTSEASPINRYRAALAYVTVDEVIEHLPKLDPVLGLELLALKCRDMGLPLEACDMDAMARLRRPQVPIRAIRVGSPPKFD